MLLFAELIVQQTPEVSIDEGAGVTVPYGSTVEFNCQVVAFPLPKTASFRDSKGNELIVKVKVQQNCYDAPKSTLLNSTIVSELSKRLQLISLFKRVL